MLFDEDVHPSSYQKYLTHFTTLQKFADRITGAILERIVENFILLLTDVKQIFLGIDSTGFKPTTNASQYYTYRAKLMSKKKWVKLSIGADMIKQIICKIKIIRRAPTTRHDNNIDFKPIVTKTTTAQIKPLLSIVVADKGYDSEENHELIRDKLHAYSIIPPRYQLEEVPVWKSYGSYRKQQMKYGYLKPLYNQRNKDETIIVSFIKRLFGEHITSRLIRTQNRRELTFRCIAYNAHRVTNMDVVIMVSTKPRYYIIQGGSRHLQE
jgi:hypothetical protein